jgi:hypothetical protein
MRQVCRDDTFALLFDQRAAGHMYGTVDTTTASEISICGIDDGINLLFRDIADLDDHTPITESLGHHYITLIDSGFVVGNKSTCVIDRSLL